MTLAFDLGSVRTTEFGVAHDEPGGTTLQLVPVDDGVQAALGEMTQATWERMQELATDPEQYSPSEKHSGQEYVLLPLEHELAVRMRQIHTAENLPMGADALADSDDIFCYFARFTDNRGRRLTALRRATQFKGVLKSRLLRFVSDALRIVEDRVFKLDVDFDLLVDSSRVHILRPAAFEFASHLQDAILAAAPENIRALKRDLSFVDFGSIEGYATDHPRAARYLASIRSQATRNVSRTALKKLCRSTGVQVALVDGKLVVPKDEVMGFLEVLDRRRYQLELVSGSPERFRAGSRQKLTEP